MKQLALLFLPACFLPVATGAPEPATTVGRGNVGFSLHGEAPTLDLVAKNRGSDDPPPTDYTSSYGEAPAAAARLTLAYGLGDDTDVELAFEGQLWFYFFPLPTGASLGLRQHIDGGDMFDIALAARVGGVTTGSTKSDAMNTAVEDEASAIYGAVQAAIQVKHGFVRPLLALNVMPFKITRGIHDQPIQRFYGAATSTTFVLMFVGNHVQFGPYATLTNFESETFKGGFFPSFGLMLAFRPDRNAPKPPDPYLPGMGTPSYAPYQPRP